MTLKRLPTPQPCACSFRRLATLFGVVLGVVVTVLVLPAAADTPVACRDQVKEVPLDKRLASAGMWANLRNNPDSIKFESNRIFMEGKAASTALTPPTDACPKGCALESRPVFVFKSSPNKTLSDYDEFSQCAGFLSASTAKPHEFTNRNIRTVDELNAWIGDLSQGDGTFGEELYEKCPGACSPRFEYVISKNNGDTEAYTVNAKVICGHARDKNDNQYRLEAYWRWGCR